MSSGDKNGNNSSRMTKGCPDDESEDEDVSTTDVSNRVNVQKILESMTNAFNNTVKQKNDNKKKLNNNDNNDNKLIKTDINENKKILENNINSTLNNIDTCENKKSNFDNNDDKEKKNELLTNDNDLIDKQDTSKKDGNPPRIVLTFRTINETTDDGKKTKISSCGSNLSLVPDELVNCDNIGGVSVKIEHSNEQSDQINKEKDNEIVKNSKEVKSSKKLQNQDNNDDVNKTIVGDDNADDNNDDNTINNNDNNDNDDKIKKTNQVTVDDSDVKNNSDKIDENNKTNNATNNVDVPVSRKRKYACKSRALVESAPLPKRSTRRLSKDSFSVLESAMAIKEKSYYTEERKRTYTKPSKNKKLQKDIKETNKKKTTISDTSFTDNNNTSLDDSKNQNSSDDDNKKLNGDFDDMPKLTPMIRQYSNTKKKNDSINNDADIDKPFLRPSASNKPRRERYRGKFISKKAGKLDSVENTTSSKLKLPTTTTSTSAAATEADEKKNDYPEESHVTTKRTRRSMMQSPSPAEGQASKPESTALTTENYLQNLMCLCQIQSQLYCEAKGTDAPLYCTAVDSIDGRLIGCCNAVDDEDVTMRRPSTRVPFIILCRTHKERLLRHNCCPSCGLFCTQGKFIQCINGHQYHINCDILYNKKSVCPHCGTDNPKSIISITMSSTRKPVYIPTRKQFTKITSAKMSLPGNGDNTMLAERPPSLSIIEPDYIKIPDVTLNKDKPERFTISSLYTAVKENDLNKLVNILASGYNSNHIYRDNLNRTVLHLASQYGYLGCVNILVQSGAQLDVMDKNQLTPLMLASENNHIDVVRYLIRAGCDVRIKGKYGMTALHLAAKTGSIDACKIIITECKIPKTLVDTVDDGGWTSLIWASEFRHDNIVRYLIDKKCDPLIRDTEQNIALHWSAYGGCSKITEILLNEGCDVNAVNACGDTPLHIAARQNRYAVTVLLLARGAKINETNNNGQTPIDCCETDGDTIDALRLNANINKSNDNLLEKTFKILTNDISRGKEKNPIQCINGIDNEDKPVDFIYITENCLTTNIFIDRTITSLQSCHCEDNCNSDKCLCGNISLKCWYDKVGKLIPEFNYTDPPMLFECNPACDCNKITCNNRVVQHGITQRFELFRTHKKGWGIKTLRFIPKGTYVCEYVGEILSDSEADNREDDSYLFDLDNRDGETFCIDARRYGNVARFINHSCAPNLLPVRIFVEHQDLRFPRIAFFANRDIDADEELGFDYGEKFWIIKSKSFNCTCGAINCHYSDKTKSLTCNNYKTRISQEEKSTSAKS